MYGIDMEKEGAQAYYDSLFELYAEWGVVYIKADDILTDYPGPYHKAEIEAIRSAIDKCGRPMVLSLSPGPAPVNMATHLREHANLWRISADFWDRWPDLHEMFNLCNAWTGLGEAGFWPDADMLPLGRISLDASHGEPRQSLFTQEEQKTLITLWSIYRSPLMMGGDLPSLDDQTLELLTNREVLAVNQKGSSPRQLYRHQHLVAWLSESSHSNSVYFALFNLSDKPDSVPLKLSQLGRHRKVAVRDLWQQKDIGEFESEFSQLIPAHGSALFLATFLD